MKKLSIFFAIPLLCVGLFAMNQRADLAEVEKEVPPPGTINFIGKNTVATAKGTFKKWTITKSELDLDQLADAEVVISVDIASIDTKNKKRDDHLRTADFFDVKKYPKATLKIYEIQAGDEKDSYTARLDFNLHGIKKTYPELAFKIVEKDPIKVEGKFTFNRLDFKVGKPKTLNPMSIVEAIPITFSATLPQ